MEGLADEVHRYRQRECNWIDNQKGHASKTGAWGCECGPNPKFVQQKERNYSPGYSVEGIPEGHAITPAALPTNLVLLLLLGLWEFHPDASSSNQWI
jgi:hypothetical protein